MKKERSNLNLSHSKKIFIVRKQEGEGNMENDFEHVRLQKWVQPKIFKNLKIKYKCIFWLPKK